MSGVEDDLAKILRIFVAASNHDRGRSQAAAASNAGHRWPMQTSLGYCGTGGKATAFRIPGDMAKHTLWHMNLHL
jgi:hypothetical protein